MERVVQAGLRDHLGARVLHFELDLVEPGVNADPQAHRARELREDEGMGPGVPDDQVDLVDLEF